MSSSKTKFGNYIRQRRIELNLTQAEVAKNLKTSQNFITYLEKDLRKPTDDMLKKLSKILLLPIDQLYTQAHPELSHFLDIKDDGQYQRKVSPILEELKNDNKLRKQYEITNEEINELSSIKLRGEIKTKEDYLFLLMSIRQVMK